MPDAKLKSIKEILANTGSPDKDVNAAVDQFDLAGIIEIKDLEGTTEPKGVTEILGKAGLPQTTVDKFLRAIVAEWNAEKGLSLPTPPANANLKTIKVILEATDCNADEKNKTILAFSNVNVTYVTDLGTKDAVGTKIDSVLNDSKLALADTVKKKFRASLIAAWEGDQKPGAAADAPPAETKTVPTGGVDITTPKWPTLKAETAGTVAEFRIPDTYAAKFSPNDPEYKSPGALQEWEWLHVARANNLTKAVNLNRMYDPSILEPTAQRAAFLWKLMDVPTDITEGDVASTISNTIEEDQNSRHHLVTGSVSASYWGSEASIKASYQLDAAQAKYEKRIHMRAKWAQPRCKLDMKMCLEVSPALEHIVSVALEKKKDKDGEDAFYFLRRVFDEFGHVVPESVYLGGVLEFSNDAMSIETKSNEDVKANVDASVKVVMGQEADKTGGSLGFGYDFASQKALNKAEFIQKISFRSVGGDPSKVGDPKTWVPTVNDCKLWKVLRREGSIPITEFLTLDLKQKIEQVEKAKQGEMWCSDGLAKLMEEELAELKKKYNDPKVIESNRQLKLPAKFALPYFARDHRLTLRNLADQSSDRSYLPAKNGVPVGNQPGEGNVPDENAIDEDGKDVSGTQHPPGDRCREIGKNYNWCQPAPVRETGDAKGDSPEENEYLWSCEYTGRYTSEGEPLYWLVTQDGGWVLSVYRQPGYCDFASLFAYDEEKKRRKQATPAKWVLRPAIAPGLGDLPPLRIQRSGYFLLWNPYYRSYLRQEGTCSSHRKYKTKEWRTVPHAVVGGGGVYYTRELVEVVREEKGPQFGRTMVWAKGDAFNPIFDVTTGKIRPAEHAGDEGLADRRARLFKQMCWLIQDRTPVPTEPRFPELETLNQWIEEQQKKKVPV
jgi:hypothetical protein